MADFLPRRDLDLVAFSKNFVDRVARDPAHFSTTPSDVARLALEQAAYAAAYRRATAPSTNSRLAVRQKNDARDLLKGTLRRLVRLVRATPGVTGGGTGRAGVEAATRRDG